MISRVHQASRGALSNTQHMRGKVCRMDVRGLEENPRNSSNHHDSLKAKSSGTELDGELESGVLHNDQVV